MMKKSDFLSPAPPDYKWPQCPEADLFIRERIAEFLQGHSFARRLSERMRDKTSTEFQMWIDYLILPKTPFLSQAEKVGYVPQPNASAPAGMVCYWHPFADLPRLVFSARPVPMSCAIMADSISDFQLAHRLSLPIAGAPLSGYRESRLAGENGELRIVERRGTCTVVPTKTGKASVLLEELEALVNRQRTFATLDEGLKHTLALAKRAVKRLGTGLGAWAFLEAERRYWQARNRAGQAQKMRQDRLGLGWANHDHHTFRSSRAAFTGLVQILTTFGFKKRERYWAGAEAGWGAQVMEQPEARLIIFADVDLSPQEVSVDFSKERLADLPKPGTVGLWCALHGESILEAGMHHLEAKFDFEHMRDTLAAAGINFMKPFSDFPHLRQAFSEGEWWPVSPKRLEALRAANKISPEAYEQIKKNGAVGSHLENLQRRNGFKGFNQKSVSQIIREVNPEAQATRQIQGPAA